MRLLLGGLFEGLGVQRPSGLGRLLAEVWQGDSASVLGIETFGDPARENPADAQILTGSCMVDPAEAVAGKRIGFARGLDCAWRCACEQWSDVDTGLIDQTFVEKRSGEGPATF